MLSKILTYDPKNLAHQCSHSSVNSVCGVDWVTDGLKMKDRE